MSIIDLTSQTTKDSYPSETIPYINLTAQFYLRLFISERDMLDLNLLVRTGVFVGLNKLLIFLTFEDFYSKVFSKLRHLTRPPKLERAEPGLSSITEPGLKQSKVRPLIHKIEVCS